MTITGPAMGAMRTETLKAPKKKGTIPLMATRQYGTRTTARRRQQPSWASLQSTTPDCAFSPCDPRSPDQTAPCSLQQVWQEGCLPAQRNAVRVDCNYLGASHLSSDRTCQWVVACAGAGFVLCPPDSFGHHFRPLCLCVLHPTYKKNIISKQCYALVCLIWFNLYKRH